MSFHALAIVTCMAALLLGAGWLFAGRLAELITNVSLFAVLVNALLAGLGLYEYRARRAGPAILISVAVELLLLLGYGTLLLRPAVGLA